MLGSGVAAQHIDRDVRRVPVRSRSERAAEEAEVFGELDGVAIAGAFVEQVGDERRQPGQLRVVVIGARANERAQRDERRVVILGDEDAQSVRQRLARDVRKAIRTRRSGGRSGGAEVCAHAASGTKMLVTRFSGTRYFAATRTRSSVVARVVRIEPGVHALRIAEVRRHHADEVRARVVVLDLMRVLDLGSIARARHLVFGDAAAGQPRELFVERALELRDVDAFSRGGMHHQHAGRLGRQNVGGDVLRDLLLVHEGAVEAARPCRMSGPSTEGRRGSSRDRPSSAGDTADRCAAVARATRTARAAPRPAVCASA